MNIQKILLLLPFILLSPSIARADEYYAAYMIYDRQVGDALIKSGTNDPYPSLDMCLDFAQGQYAKLYKMAQSKAAVIKEYGKNIFVTEDAIVRMFCVPAKVNGDNLTVSDVQTLMYAQTVFHPQIDPFTKGGWVVLTPEKTESKKAKPKAGDVVILH